MGRVSYFYDFVVLFLLRNRNRNNLFSSQSLPSCIISTEIWENVFGLRNLNISNNHQVIEICNVIPIYSAHVSFRTYYKFISNVSFIFSAKPYHESSINNFVSVFTLKGSKCTACKFNIYSSIMQACVKVLSEFICDINLPQILVLT